MTWQSSWFSVQNDYFRLQRFEWMIFFPWHNKRNCKTVPRSVRQFKHHLSIWFSASSKHNFDYQLMLFPPRGFIDVFLCIRQATGNNTNWSVFMCTKPHLWQISFSCIQTITCFSHGYLYTGDVQTVRGLGFSNLIKTPPIYCILYCCLTIAPHYILPAALS